MTTQAALNPAQTSPLALLLATKGFTFSSISNLIPDCSVTLLERISLARQPFPVDLAKEISVETSIDLGSLLATTKFWTRNSGPLGREALPPDPLLGDPIPPNTTTATLPLVFPTPPPPVPEVWVVGDGIGTLGAPGAQAINRNTGLVIHQVSFANTVTPVEIASTGNELWTFGFGLSGGTSYFARIDPNAGTLNSETNANHTEFLGICFEPTAGMIWACSTTSTSLFRYNPGALVLINPDASIALSVGPKNFEPKDVLVFNGLLYVSAVYPTGVLATPFEGRIFELDPVAFSILRVSTGTDLGNVQGITVDGLGNLWTVSGAGGGTINQMVLKTPISSFVSAQVPLIGDPGVLTDPQWIEFIFGSYWISDATAPNGRIFEMDAGGNVLQSRTFASGVSVGHVVGDGKFLWYADKAGGFLHLIHPSDISITAFTVNVGGSPDGLIVLA